MTLVSEGKCSSEMFDEVLLLSIALLLGGNRNVQDAFLEELMNDPNNHFLIAIREKVTRTFTRIKKAMNKFNK